MSTDEYDFYGPFGPPPTEPITVGELEAQQLQYHYERLSTLYKSEEALTATLQELFDHWGSIQECIREEELALKRARRLHKARKRPSWLQKISQKLSPVR